MIIQLGFKRVYLAKRVYRLDNTDSGNTKGRYNKTNRLS